VFYEVDPISVPGLTLPTWAWQQVGSHLGAAAIKSM
jgi:hypothetical protein